MNSPFVSDVPAAEAHTAWLRARAAAGCPPRVEVVRVSVGEAVGRVGAAVLARVAGAEVEVMLYR